jgi:hypothetical protein
MEYNEALGAGLVQQFYDNREQYRATKSTAKAFKLSEASGRL